MNTARHCARCGAALAAASLGERCPRCVLQFALDPSAAGDGVAPAPERVRVHCFGDYELLGEIARGGMGVVYKARQVSLNRTVAVKMLLAGPFSSEDYVKRFRSEAESAANLQHPNIVAIHEVGEHDGQQYFSMEYIEGQDLAQLVRDQPLPARRAAGIVRTIALAVHYAHQRGVIHRDLKPSNVLLAPDGQPRITDFGLAKRLTRDTTTSVVAEPLTITGQVLGTPGFMPPEQASGRRVTAAPTVDVYSLGAILYFLLTARAPFATDSLEATLRQVLESEPVSPRLLNSEAPRDLETICLKCLEKDPRNRFASAQELATELDRFLAGQPIRSRPVSSVEKVWRWGRRHPAVTFLLLALAGSMGAGFLGIQWQLRRAQASELAARRTAYAADMNLVQSALADNNLRRARELLERNRPRRGELDLRGWEWRYAWQCCQSDAIATVQSGVNDPLHMFFLANNPQLFVGTPDGDIVAVERKGGNYEVARRLPSAGQIAVIASSPDGKWLAVTAERGVVHVCDTNGMRLTPGLVHSNLVTSLSFSPDGEWLATSTMRGQVTIWEWRTGKMIRSVRTPTFDGIYFGDVAFSPMGRKLAVGQSNGRLWLMNAETGEGPWAVAGHGEPISALAFSPDGKLLASGSGYSESTIKIWNAVTGEPVASLGGHNSWISALAFSPDGTRLASASAEQTVRLWDVATWKQARLFRGHLKEVHCLAFAPDGNTLASAGQDGVIHFWDTESTDRQTYPVVVPERQYPLSFTPDGAQVFAISFGEVLHYDTVGFRERERLRDLGTNNSGLALSADGRILVAGDDSGRLKIWDVSGGRLLTNFAAHSNVIRQIGFSRDDGTLFTGGDDRLLKRWHRGDWRFMGERSSDPNLTFRTSRLLARHQLWVSEHVGEIKVWDALDGRLVAHLSPNEGLIDDIACSPDGQWIVTAHQSGSVVVYDMRTWELFKTLRGHLTGVHGVVFSADGLRMATGSNGREAVKLWDTTMWQELATLPGRGSLFRTVQFSPDGSVVTATSSRRRTHYWRAPSFREKFAGQSAPVEVLIGRPLRSS
ncbi:MAG: protein kinase [Verrucomicrobia bacterium]|nr:protein kinase [Verrucomicrobiota bacterium]